MLTVCENNAVQNKIISVSTNFVQNEKEIYPVTVNEISDKQRSDAKLLPYFKKN